MSNETQEDDEKVAYFQEVTGMQDALLSSQILEAHGWDLHAAVSSLTDETPVAADRDSSEAVEAMRPDASRWNSADADRDASGSGEGARSLNPDSANYDRNLSNHDRHREDDDPHHGRYAEPGPGIVWQIVALPFSIVRGSYNIMYGAFGLGMWAAGGVISYSLGALGLGASDRRPGSSQSLLPVPTGTAEASLFLRNFEREYGDKHPAFQTMGFMEALRRSGQQFKFLFVYLHAPDHANTPAFCEITLCSEAVMQFVNENFVVWGGDVRSSEGFQMSASLKASTFPFCAVVTASANQRIALVQQVEGLKTSSELIAILQRVVDEQGPALVAARVEEEERQLNRRLREEQDAAFQAALEADQERERKRQEEAQQAAREAQEEERRKLDEVEAKAQAELEAAEREKALELRRQEKAASLGLEPEKGVDVTQVLVRLPNGERRDRRFHSHEHLQKVYDYVDSLGSFDALKYTLVSNFPRTVYGPDKLGSSLKDAGLHPHASLFVQVEDN